MQKRRRNFVAPIFAKGDLDDVCESVAIEDRADSIPDVEHEDSQPAVNLVRARTGGVRRLANAADRRQRPFNQTNDLAKFDPVHRPGEGVSAKFSASALDVSSCLKLRENLLKKFDRQFFL